MPRVHNTISTKHCATLSYYKQGNGTTAVVFVHGFPEDASIWFATMDKLEDAHTLIAVDLPGVGYSTAATSELSMEVMAMCVQDILDAEKLEKVVIVGHSMGGYVALAYVDIFPNKVVGVSMVHSTAAQDNEDKIKNRQKAISIIDKGGKDIFIKQMMLKLFSHSFVLKQEHLVDDMINKALSIKGESLVAFYNAMIKRSDRSDILLHKAFPVQWLIGADDVVTLPKNTMQHCISANVNFVSLYADCAHMCMVEKKDALYKDLSNFLVYCYH